MQILEELEFIFIGFVFTRLIFAEGAIIFLPEKVFSLFGCDAWWVWVYRLFLRRINVYGGLMLFRMNDEMVDG
jgi:hypothetical protein